MRRLLLVTPIAVWCWLAMVFVHELGHVAAAWLTGGQVVHGELRPGYLPQTLVRPNPRPSVVIWAGLVVGCVAPLSGLALRSVRWMWIGAVADFWPSFCLLAGGVYLAVGGAEPLTDTGQLIALGWSLWLLVSIGVAVATFGYLRSRASILRIASEFRRRDVRLEEIASWWLLLIVWCVVQSIIAGVMVTHRPH